MSQVSDFVYRLKTCPPGLSGWKKFEDLCVEILCYLFVPPLSQPKKQARSYSGIDRVDAVFPNRNFTGSSNWTLLFKEHEARMILFEFKNYDKEEIGKDEVEQTKNYMKDPMGRLAIMVCNKKPNEAAFIKRNTIYSSSNNGIATKKIILFVTKKELKEMLYIKERGEDPSDYIVDQIEDFYIQHE